MSTPTLSECSRAGILGAGCVTGGTKGIAEGHAAERVVEKMTSRLVIIQTSPSMRARDWLELARIVDVARVGTGPERKRARASLACLLPRLKSDAKAGQPTAQAALPWVYGYLGRRMSTAAAIQLYEQAAKREEPTALLSLGLGEIGRGRRARGVSLLRRAVKAGSVDALAELGGLYLTGLGVRRDLRVAERLLRRACRNGSMEGAFYLGVKRDFYDTGRQAEATRWYRLAAAGGHVRGMYNYALCLERGLGVRRSLRAAAIWYSRVAQAGGAEGRSAARSLRALQAR